MDKAIIGCIVFLVYLAIYAAIGALIALGAQWAWNALIPVVFHGPSIDYTEAYAGYFLITLFLGMIRGTVSAESKS